VGAVFGVEFADVAEAVTEAVVGPVEGTSGDVFEHQVVHGDVQHFGDAGDAGDDVEGGGDAPVLVAADLAGVGADLGGQFALGPAGFVA
jgi:hypothetical protein